MTNLFFQIALSNAFIALLLAFVALAVEAATKRSQLAHLLWLLVFVKLVTPPIVALPVIPNTVQSDSSAHSLLMDTPAEDPSSFPSTFMEKPYSTPSLLSNVADASNRAKPFIATIWVLGSGIIFLGSLTRVYLFNRLLKIESDEATHKLHASARRIAYRLGLNTTPDIYTTAAHLSPMVWWMGGKVRVIIPLSLINQMDPKEMEWILAHELAHVRRRDYLVRWIEWLACVCFWWNPLVWWARHRLRFNEEICCDDLVLASFDPTPHTYATALLNAIEFLAAPVIRPPAMASEVNSGGFLERRFKMITSKTSSPSITRWPQVCALLLAVAFLPVGLTFAENHKGAEKKQSTEYYQKTWEKLQAKVEAGEMTQKEAHEKMTAIKKKAQVKNKQPSEKKEAVVKKEKKQASKKQVDAKKKQSTDEYYQKTWKKLQAKVEAGEMTQKEAHEKMTAIKKKAQAKKKQPSQKKEAVVKKEKKQANEKQVDAKKKQSTEYYQKTWKKLLAKVEAGEMTKKEAHEKMTAIKKKGAGKKKKDL